MPLTNNKPLAILIVVNLVSLGVIFWLLWMVMGDRDMPHANDQTQTVAAVEALPVDYDSANNETPRLQTGGDDEAYDELDHAALAELGGWNTTGADASAHVSTSAAAPLSSETASAPEAQAGAERSNVDAATPGQDKQTAGGLTDRELAYLALLKNASAERTNEVRLVRVRRGDTLWKISRRVYGSGFRHEQILKANPHLKSPQDITVGEYLRLPK